MSFINKLLLVEVLCLIIKQLLSEFYNLIQMLRKINSIETKHVKTFKYICILHYLDIAPEFQITSSKILDGKRLICGLIHIYLVPELK